MLKEPEYAPLVKYIRNGLVEQVHNGIILYMNKDGIIKKAGNDNNYMFYHRSCMKPMQFSPVIDLGLDKKYNLSSEEIAVCCASHTGDIIHQNIIHSVLKKAGLSQENLLCLPHEPLSKKEEERLILLGIKPQKIHNKCSGKHSAMLMIAKELGFNISNYKDFENPLSAYIINKVCELCETDRHNVIISKDGCGLPVIATTLEQLGKGFLNLFCSEKYNKITSAFLQNPYIIGGDYRLDSELINSSKNLVAKVGACGLCVVVNIVKQECIVVKIADSNMDARTIAVIDAIKQLKWPIDDNLTGQINDIYCKDIVSQDGVVLGEIKSCFELN